MRICVASVALLIAAYWAWADEPLKSEPAADQKPVRAIDTLFVGSEAPDFTLKSADGKEMTLSQFRGKRPVALVFGSYT